MEHSIAGVCNMQEKVLGQLTVQNVLWNHTISIQSNMII